MATNADGKDKSEGADDADQAPEDLLRAAKYPGDDVESSKDADETSEDDDAEEESDEAEAEDDGQTDDEAADEDELEDDADADSDEDDSYVKEFPNIKGDNLPDYARNLEKAYNNSTAEALRLKSELDKLKANSSQDDAGADKDTQVATDPTSLYMKQKMDEEISEAYGKFSKSYGQVNDPVEYQKFVKEVAAFSASIFQSQQRLAPPHELYNKAAISLGWEPETTPTGNDKLKVALKDGASISKTSSATKKVPKSKVTDAQVAVYRKMHGADKSDADIRKELEVYA